MSSLHHAPCFDTLGQNGSTRTDSAVSLLHVPKKYGEKTNLCTAVENEYVGGFHFKSMKLEKVSNPRCVSRDSWNHPQIVLPMGGQIGVGSAR